MKAPLLVLCAVALGGCSVSGHTVQHRYWAFQEGFAQLPPVDVHAERGYISYPLLLSRKRAFAGVTDGCDEHPIDIRIQQTLVRGPHPVVLVPWIVASAFTLTLLPVRHNHHIVTEFTVMKGGVALRTYRYENDLTTWVTLVAALQFPRKDRYRVEEEIADQFANSFILDLLEDEEVMAQLRPAPAKAGAIPTSSGAPAAATPPPA